ncbi:hypothetical protein Bca52824_068823 [Brassica carinata]|uniref:Nudix hydrolase n=1 Tax=Brassica carinata TaxID=52824 RepID=A0A8X7Q654_BRACI|nr:hypothetical protein Bca52824_068823 [Brassica carinata]
MSHPMDPSAFSALLRTSLSNWTLQGKKGVWIKLPRHLIGLAETAVKEGFWFHHAEKDYLMLVYWIPKKTIRFLLMHLTVLVVQEKTGRTKGKGIWKFPTGVVNEGEYINDGSVREVKEETGPLSFEINAQESEIEAAQWMPWEEYTKQPFIQNHELLRYMTDICSAKTNGDYEGFTSLSVSEHDQQGNLYFNSHHLHPRH